MSLTRANVESVLIRRVGALLTAVSLDGTTVDGTNGDLNDPIGWGLRQAGYSVASPTAVADTDVDDVGTADYDEVFDLAELRALENAHSAALTLVTTWVGPRKEDMSDMAKGLEVAIQRRREWCEEVYDLGVGMLEGGILELDFVEKGD